jgi:hypothetical protein
MAPNSGDSTSSGAFAASFTGADDSKLVFCDLGNRCKAGGRSLPAGTKLFFMEDKRAGHLGKNLCDVCYQHYGNKSTTIRKDCKSSLYFLTLKVLNLMDRST